MSYRLKPGHPVDDSIRRIGAEQASSILSHFSRNASQGDAVHQARKAIKRLRALLVLIRPAIAAGDYGVMQEHLKAVARSVSGLRDAQAMLATIAKLEAHDPAIGGGPVAAALRTHLEARRTAVGKRVDRSARTAARKTVKEVHDGFAQLSLGDGFEPLALALKANYRKARRAFEHAYEDGHDEAFHEWRKLVQRHWRHLQLVAGAWPKGIQPHVALARDLSGLLGEDHDLSVLAALVNTEAKALGTAAAVKAYVALCRERQRVLREKASVYGARLFAEKPASFAGRIGVYWEGAEKFESGSACKKG